MGNDIYNIIHFALEGSADFDENVTGDNGTIFTHLGDGGDTDAGFFSEFFFLHVAVNSEFE